MSALPDSRTRQAGRPHILASFIVNSIKSICLAHPVLCRISFTWVFTVFSLHSSSLAICLDDISRPQRTQTSVSGRVRPTCFA